MFHSENCRCFRFVICVIYYALLLSITNLAGDIFINFLISALLETVAFVLPTSCWTAWTAWPASPSTAAPSSSPGPRASCPFCRACWGPRVSPSLSCSPSSSFGPSRSPCLSRSRTSCCCGFFCLIPRCVLCRLGDRCSVHGGAVCVCTCYSVIDIYGAERCPTVVRGSTMGLGMTFSRIGGFSTLHSPRGKS